MLPPDPRRSLAVAASMAVLAGTLIAALGVGGCAWLAQAGLGHTAGLIGEAMLLLALSGMAAAILAVPPNRLRRARVPVSRAVPHQWWPQQSDPTPLLAACAGAPVALGAAAVVVLFH
ncbi:MAG: hypothetical protein ACYDAC_03910 [Candidatus Dormibacteria bacterium]